MTLRYPIHPLALIFPALGEEELKRLAADIKANGQQQPIVLWDGQVLDGRNRLAACALAGVKPQFTEYAGPPERVLAWVVSQNLQRRHLTPSQQAFCAADAAERQGISSAAAAAIVGLEARHVQYARVVVEKAVPELREMVRAGTVSVFDAHKLALHRGPTKQRSLAALGPAAVHAEAQKIAHHGAEREEALAPHSAPAPAKKADSRSGYTRWHPLLELDRVSLQVERDRLPILEKLLTAMIARMPPKGTAAAYIDLDEFYAMLREAMK